MKLFIALAGLVAVCSTQQTSYPFSAYLDMDGWVAYYLITAHLFNYVHFITLIWIRTLQYLHDNI